MDILQNTIKILEKEELKSYKLFAKRSNNHEIRRDIELFDSIKKHNDKPDQYHYNKIYGENKPDSKYYRLKNKIAEDIGTVLCNLNQKQEDVNTLHLLQLAKIFKHKKINALSLHYLKLAEKKALLQEDFAVLEAIYEEMIKINSQNSEEDPAPLIKRRLENNKRLLLLQELENNLALLSFTVKTTQNLTTQKETKQWLKNILKTTVNHSYVKNSKLLRIKVFQNLSRIMMLLKDYHSLENYLITCLQEFEHDNLFAKNNHEIKLQLLIYLCNTLFLLEKHHQAISYADVLYKQLLMYDKKHYNQYLFYYYNILVNNYSKTNLIKAIDTLEKAKEETQIKQNSNQYFYVLSNLAITLFDAKKFKQAGKIFSQIYLSSGYKLLDNSVVFKLHVFELVNRLEIGDYDACFNQIQIITKLKNDITNKENIKIDLAVTEIIKTFLTQETIRWRPLKPYIVKFMSLFDKNQTHIGLIDYCNWLSSKI